LAFDSGYVDEENRMHLTLAGADIEGFEPFALPAGGNGAASVMKLSTSLTDWPITVMEHEDSCVIPFCWSSTLDGEVTGSGSVEWTVNGSRVALLAVEQGECSFDVRPFLASGAENAVLLKVTDVYGTFRTMGFAVTVVAFGLGWNLGETAVYDGAVAVRLTPSGSGKKLLKVAVDGSIISEAIVTTTGRTTTVTVPGQNHGAHVITAWVEATVEGETLTTDALRHVGVWLSEGVVTPVVGVLTPEIEVGQYGTAAVRWFVVDPAAETARVELKVDGTAVNVLQNVGRDVQLWAYKANEKDSHELTIHHFNLKTNVASSESANNVCLADEFNTFNPFICQAKREDPRVRDTVEGHPCAVFFTSTADDAIEVGARTVLPGETILYFVGDMNNSKKNFAAFGQDNSKWPKQCSVEIINNTEKPCRFKENIGEDETFKDGNFEFRFPKATTEEMKEAFTAMQRWVVSTDREAATGVTFAKGCPLTEVRLPAVSSLVALELRKLDTFLMDSSALTLLRVEGCPGIDTLNICKNAPVLERGRLTEVDWRDTDAALLMRLTSLAGYDGQGKPTERFVLTGRAHVGTISQLQIDAVTAAFPELELSYDEIVASVTVTFQNYDGTTQKLKDGSDAVFTVASGGTIANPITAGLMDKPVKPPDVEHRYSYSGWDKSLEGITADTLITARYSASDRYYRVTRWLDISESRMLQESMVIAHGRDEYKGDDPEQEGALWMGWDANTGDLVSDMDVHALFIVPKLPDAIPEKYDFLYSDDPEDDSAFSLAELAGILEYGMEKTYFRVGDRIRIVPDTEAFADSAVELQVEVRSSAGGMKTDIVTSADWLFLHSAVELGVNVGEFPYCDEVDRDAESAALPCFTDNASRIRKRYNGMGSAAIYWLRSPDPAVNNQYWMVQPHGSATIGGIGSGLGPASSRGVCCACCMGGAHQ